MSVVAVLEIIMATAAINSTKSNSTSRTDYSPFNTNGNGSVGSVGGNSASKKRTIQPQLHQNAHDHSQKLYDQRIVLAMFYYRIES